MKRRRLQLLLGASFVFLLILLAWWWTTWPERTMQKVCTRAVAGELWHTSRMIASGHAWGSQAPPAEDRYLTLSLRLREPRPPSTASPSSTPAEDRGEPEFLNLYRLSHEEIAEVFRYDRIQALPRSFSDWIAGRARFKVAALEFMVQWGKLYLSGPFWPEEPVYEGKQISAWLQQLRHEDPKVILTAVPPDYMVEARLAFQRMGADVVPFLIDKLKHSPEQKERRYVAEALGWIGPEAKAAVPTLVQALNEERSRFGELSWPYWQPFAEALVKIDANAPKQAGLE